MSAEKSNVVSDESPGETAKKKTKTKITVIICIALVVAAGVGFGINYFMQSANVLITENARVTTNLAQIIPPMPGRLERFTVYEGKRVRENEVIGWVENGESFRAPFDGIVVRTSAEQDHIVSPMEPVAVIADINNLHIRANIEETYITRIRVGQEATVTIDAFGRRQFSGHVTEIGRVTDAELTGTAMFFNTGGTFTKVTQLIPVQIRLTDDVVLDNLIGLNATVRIPLN